MADYDPTDEYLLMQQAGLSFSQVLASLGRIAPGMDADLVVIEGNPERDITALARVRYAVRQGSTTGSRPPAEDLLDALTGRCDQSLEFLLTPCRLHNDRSQPGVGQLRAEHRTTHVQATARPCDHWVANPTGPGLSASSSFANTG